MRNNAKNMVSHIDSLTGKIDHHRADVIAERRPLISHRTRGIKDKNHLYRWTLGLGDGAGILSLGIGDETATEEQ